MAKWVYMFTEGNADMRNLLGGKGANLAEMTNLGLPVPQGFTVTTEACTQYYEDGRQINDEIMAQIMEAIDKMEGITGKKFGDKENPLLVSVRSGARASMPGMMDTILNLGLNEEVVETLAKASGNPRWAWDCYRRFIQMFSDVVMEVGKKYFEELIDKMKAERGVKQDVELTAEDLHELANQFKAEYKEKIGTDFPTDPKEQLTEAIKAVFRSWDNPRANVYRRDNDIPYSWGTAVNVQMMAFGNMGDDCGTGVAFTRDPATGEKGLFGEFLTNAQGEDVVAGVRTPMQITEMERKFPEAFIEFKNVCKTLEKHYRDMVILTKDFLVDLKSNGGFSTFKYSDVKWIHIHSVKYYGIITTSSSIIVHLNDGKTNIQCIKIKGGTTEEFLNIFNKICEKVPTDCLKGYTQENIKAFKKYKKENGK